MNFRNRIRVTLTGADTCKSLRMINENGIALYQINQQDELTVLFQCSRKDRKKLYKIVSKRGDSLNIENQYGVLYSFRSFSHRTVLAATFLILFLLTLYLPTRVFFFEVKGNSLIPSEKILESAEHCGIHFGASRKMVRSEQMKNVLLETMPELKWAGINTSGCTAVISVREREIKEETKASVGVSNIVAANDGFITSCTVTQGNALCVPGQVVRKGEMLVSGYTDCGICLQVTGAEGEIYAITSHSLSMVTPSECALRYEKVGVSRRYTLIIGKKHINLWKGSGISPASCGRMYKEYYITLPGGFQLPFGLRVETLTQWKTVLGECPENEISQQMESNVQSLILSQTVAGSILRDELIFEQKDGLYQLNAHFLCSEMIGRVITEEIGDTNGKNH